MQKSPSTTLPSIDLTGASFAQLEAYEGKLDAFKVTLQTVKKQRQQEIAQKIKRSAEEAHLTLSAIMKLTAGTSPVAMASQAHANPNGNGKHTPKVAKAPKVAKPSKGIVPVKFRDSHGNTWTGRGMAPKWLSAAEKAGHKREEFRIPA